MRATAWIFAITVGGNDDLGIGGELEIGGKNADYREDVFVNSKMELCEIGGRTEILVPVCVTNEGNGSGAFLSVRSNEIATNDWLNAKDSQELGSDGCDHRARRLRAARYRQDVRAVLRHSLQSVILIAEVVEVRVGEARPSAFRIDLEYGHDAVGIVVRQRTQQDSVDHAEDGSGGADGECQCDDRDSRETGAAPQDAEGVAKVVN